MLAPLRPEWREEQEQKGLAVLDSLQKERMMHTAHIDEQIALPLSDTEYAAQSAQDEFVPSGSYITTRDPKQETLLTRESQEDAYVGIGDAFDPLMKNGVVVGIRVKEGFVADSGDQALTYDEWKAQQNNTTPVSDDEPTHTVRVEGVLMQVVPYELLYGMGDKALNIYTDKDGYVRVGSVRFRTLANGAPVAECVKCKQTLVYKGESRRDQEQFILGSLTHGHNHQAKGWKSTTVYDERGRRFTGPRYVLDENNKRVALPPVAYFSDLSRTPIGNPIAESILNSPISDELVASMNDWLFDEQVVEQVAPARSLDALKRRNGFA